MWFTEDKTSGKLIHVYNMYYTIKVLYIGDGLKNDAFPASRFAHWGALIILEGMEVEGCVSSAMESEKSNCHCKVMMCVCVCVCVCVGV